MDKRKAIILAIVLFLVIGLGTFVFANPEEEVLDGNNTNITDTNSNSGNDNKDNTDADDTTSTGSQTATRRPANVSSSNTSQSSPSQTTDESLANAEKAVEKAESSLSQNDIDSAKDLVNNLVDSTEKEELSQRVEALQNVVDVTKLVETLANKVETAQDKEDIDDSRDYRTTNDIVNAVNKLTDSSNKDELVKTLNELAKTLDDKTAPELDGVKDESTNNTDITVTVDDENEVSIKINGKEATLEDLKDISAEGSYTITVVDAAYNETEISFAIDKSKPTLNVESGTHSDDKIDVVVYDDTFDYALVYNQDKGTEPTKYEDAEFTLTEEATYKIAAYDKAGNTSGNIYVAIDKTAPEIKGIDEDAIFNENDEIKVIVSDKFLKEVTVNGVKQDLGKGKKNNEYFEVVVSPSEDGVYEIVAKDKVGSAEATFTVDTTDAKEVYSTIDINKQAINKDNVNYYYIKNSESFKFRMEFTEELSENPIAVIGGREKTMSLMTYAYSQGKYVYEATFAIDTTEASLQEGLLEILVKNVKDKAGNTSEIFTRTETSNHRSVIYDRTKPSVSGVENTNYTYDGVGVTPVTIDTDISKVTLTKNGTPIDNYELGTAIVNAGSYVLKVTDIAGHNTEVSFNIEKATPVIEWSASEGVTINGTSATATYNGVGREFTATLKKINIAENLTVTYKSQSGKAIKGLPTTADKFKVSASFAGDENYNAVAETINFQIKKANVKIEFTSEPDSYEYDNTPKEFKAIAILANNKTEELKLTYYEGDTKLSGAPVDAGTYTVVAKRSGDHNYNDSTKVTKEFTITKATPVIEWSGLGNVIYDSATKEAVTTYNGQPQEVKATLKKIGSEEELSVSYHINSHTLQSAPVGRNPYIVKTSYAGDKNYEAVEDEIKFTIKKYDATFKFTKEPSNYVYDGTPKEFKAIAVLATEEKELTLKYYEGETELPGAPVDAGTYTVKATFRGDTNNNGFGTKSRTFTITPAETEVIITLPENLVYDGTEKHAIAKAVLKGTDTLVADLNVVYKDANYGSLGYVPVDAGSYIAGAYYYDVNGNYTTSQLYQPYTIEKAETEVIITLPENLVFSNTEKVVTAKTVVKGTDILVQNLTPVYKNTNYGNLGYVPVNAGSYVVAAHFAGTQNYKASYDDKKYTITQATPVIEYDTTKVFAYDGTPKGIDFTVYDVEGNPITDSSRLVVYYKDAAGNTLNEIPTESGKYIFTLYVRPDNGGNGNYTRADVFRHDYEIVKTVSSASELTTAVANAKDGDVITLADGIYDVGSLHIKRDITLRGTSRENTIIKVNSMVYEFAGVVVQANATIDNLTITTDVDSVNVLKATFRDTDYSTPNAALDKFIIQNVNIIGGRVGLNIHGVNDALVDQVSVQSKMPLSAASGNVTVRRTTLTTGTWGASISINHKLNSTDYPSLGKVTLSWGNNIAGNLRVQEIEEGNIIDGIQNGWTQDSNDYGDGYTYYWKN